MILSRYDKNNAMFQLQQALATTVSWNNDLFQNNNVCCGDISQGVIFNTAGGTR